MAGIEAAQYIASHCPSTRVLALSRDMDPASALDKLKLRTRANIVRHVARIGWLSAERVQE